MENINQSKEMKAITKKYGKSFVSILTKNLVSAGKKASGQLIKSLSVELRPMAESIDILIKGEDYLTYVDKGRKKGSYPPVEAIKKWCRIKNIPTTAAFAISKSIYKFGIKPTHVIKKSTDMFLRTEKPKMEKDIAKLVEKEVKKIFKNKK